MRREGLELAAARAAVGLTGPERLPAVAVAALEDGMDSPALRELAGLLPGETGEARRLLDRALAELDVPVPEPRDAVMRLARELSQEIVDGTVTPYDGANQIWQLSLRDSAQQISELDSFVYAASEWEDRPEDRALLENGIRLAAHELLTASPRSKADSA